jgi:hypothetical protein
VEATHGLRRQGKIVNSPSLPVTPQTREIGMKKMRLYSKEEKKETIRKLERGDRTANKHRRTERQPRKVRNSPQLLPQFPRR